MTNKTQKKKEAWLSAMADYMLENGISASSLRPLANAAGTSDRMLIYHFKTKDELINEVLKFLFGKLADDLASVLPKERATTRLQCIQSILAALKTIQYERYTRVWLELVAYSAHQQNSFSNFGHQIIKEMLSWISGYVPITETNPERTAKAILVLLEGENVLTTLGHQDIAIDGIEFLLENTN